MVDEENELPELKTLYDELWSDARTMIKDMKRSIYIYLFAGFITLVFSVIMIGTAISDWNKILSGNVSTFTYLYAIAGTLGVIFLCPIWRSLAFLVQQTQSMSLNVQR